MFIKEISEETTVLAKFLPCEILLAIDCYKRSSVFSDRVQCLENLNTYFKNTALREVDGEFIFHIFPYRIGITNDCLTVYYRPTWDDPNRFSMYKRREKVFDTVVQQKHAWFHYTDWYPYYMQSFKEYLYTIK